MQELFQSIKNTISYIHHNDNNSIHIGYGIDDNYARCAGTSIASFCINNPTKSLVFHIITSGLAPNNLEKYSILSKKYSINIFIYEIDISYFQSLPTSNYFPISIYFRLILPLIINSTQNIIYVDADIICLKDISPLLNQISSKSNMISAAPDVNYMQKNRCIALNLKNHIYFNSGFLIINTFLWKSHSIFQKSLSILEKNPTKFSHPDQDVLNILLTQKTYYLPQIYNCIDLTTINHKDIVLLHFAANPKPWNICWSLSPNCNEFNKNLYQYYEKQTPWSGLPPTLPRNYKEMDFYAKCLRKHKYYIKSFHWYLKYLLAKIKYLIKKY